MVVADNPFPAVMGRVCYHPCETACNRGQLDEAVGINAVERSWGTWRSAGLASCPQPRRRHRQAGAGGRRRAVRALGRVSPAAPRARGDRARRGAAAGGMMRYGIPKYRLPRDVLDAEIARIVDTRRQEFELGRGR